jgi:hypothetical protein
MQTTDLYETDFYAWTQEQVSLLRTHQWNRLDTVNLIEEIEALARKERQELRNRLWVTTRTSAKVAIPVQQTH